MANDKMMAQMSEKPGFIAALDQSGGSTPGALRLYGIPDSAYSGDAEMFRLMHEMRVRIITSPAFAGAKVIAAILFEGTMDGQAQGKPVPDFLWNERGVVPFLKVDKGLEAENDGVSLMKPIPALDALLVRAVKLGIFGTKMRSVINLASQPGIAAVVKQQFDVAAKIAEHGLMPIIEPEVSIKSPDKAGAEAILLRGTDQKPGCRAGGPPGDAEADYAGGSGFLFAADETQARGQGCRAIRRLYAGRCLQAARRQSRHDRELLTGADGRPETFDERCRVRRDAGKIDRRDLPGLDREGVILAGSAPPPASIMHIRQVFFIPAGNGVRSGKAATDSEDGGLPHCIRALQRATAIQRPSSLYADWYQSALEPPRASGDSSCPLEPSDL